MPAKITHLTKEQKSRFPEWRDKWIAIGLSTERADWAKFEQAIHKCYKFAGLELPPIIHVPSPIVGALTSSIADSFIAKHKKDSAVNSAVNFSVDSAVDSAVGSVVWSAVDLTVHYAVRSAVWSAAGYAVRSAVESAVDSGVWSVVFSEVRSVVRNSAKITWHNWNGGQFWSSWHSYITFYLDVCNWTPEGDIAKRARAYAETAESACCWWPNTHFIMVCDRPTAIHLDAQGRLHHPSKKAIEWPDGWGICSWHGITVPEQVILNPETITIKQIQQESNVEIRRVMLERYGQARYLLESGAKEIHKDDWGILYSTDLINDEPLVMVKVVNSTPEPDGTFKDYFLRVDPRLRPLFENNTFGKPQELTARNAVASTFGKYGHEYRPVQES